MGIPIDAIATGGGYGTYGVGSTTGSEATSAVFGFGKDDYFKLFLAQLQNQDPTDPMDTAEMVSQLAQFTMIETLQQVSAALAGSQLSQASGLIGRQVTGVDVNGQLVNGVVDSVQQTGTTLLLVVGSQYVEPDSIVLVTAPAGGTAADSAAADSSATDGTASSAGQAT